MPSESVIRVAAVCAVLVLLLGAAYPFLEFPLNIHSDWLLITVYTLLFVCVAVLHWRNGLPFFAVALIVVAAGAAVFDTVENLFAYAGTPRPLITSGKWICFHGSLLLMSPLLVLARTRFARVAGWILVFAAIAGLGALFHRPLLSMRSAIRIMSVAFICFVIITRRDRRSLLR